jgi:HK97 family phage major capsid protein
MPYLAADPDDADWTSELGTGNEDGAMSFGKRELTPKPLAKRIKVSNKLLRLNPDVEQLVIDRLAYKFAVSYEKAGMTGSGANQPLGVFTASANGISTGRDVSTDNAQTAFTADGLKNAKYTLKAGYWARAKWVFHRDGVKMLAKLKDGEGRYLWQNSVQLGQPDMYDGVPVFTSEYAPNTFTSGLYVGIIGDFSYYHTADALDFSIQRLNELYAATNQTGFIGRLESDGMPVLEEAFVRVKLG